MLVSFAVSFSPLDFSQVPPLSSGRPRYSALLPVPITVSPRARSVGAAGGYRQMPPVAS